MCAYKIRKCQVKFHLKKYYTEHLNMFVFAFISCRRWMLEITEIWCKALTIHSINQSFICFKRTSTRYQYFGQQIQLIWQWHIRTSLQMVVLCFSPCSLSLFKALGRCYGFWAGTDLYRAVPKAKRGHSNPGLIWRVVVLWPLTAGQGKYGSILTQIPTGYLRKSNYPFSNIYFTIILRSFTFQNNTVEIIPLASLQN